MAKFVLHDKHASAGTSTKLEAEDLQEAAVLAQATAQGGGEQCRGPGDRLQGELGRWSRREAEDLRASVSLSRFYLTSGDLTVRKSTGQLRLPGTQPKKLHL